MSFNKCTRNRPNPSSPPNPTIDEMPLLWNPTAALQYVRIFSLHRRPMLLHLMTLVSFRLYFLGKWFIPPPTPPPPGKKLPICLQCMSIVNDHTHTCNTAGQREKMKQLFLQSTCKWHKKWPCFKLPHLVQHVNHIHLPPSKYDWHPTMAFITIRRQVLFRENKQSECLHKMMNRNLCKNDYDFDEWLF